MDVDRDTFPAALALLRSALQRAKDVHPSASFVALDLEMTGTAAPPGCGAPPPARCDDAPDRWAALAAAASAYLVLQVGLSVFAWDDAAARYVASTFNFNIFPYTAPEGGGNGNGGGALPAVAPAGLPPAPPFLSSPSALAFLSSAGFDFNRWVAKGIPFVPVCVRDGVATKSAAASARARDRAPIVPTRPADVGLVADTRAAVEAWLAGPASAPPLTLPPVNGFQRALIYQTLDELAGGGWAGGGEGGPADPAFVAETVRPPGARRRAPAAITLTRVAGAADAAAVAAARDAAASADLAAVAGAASLMDALREAGLPLAVHNGALDVALTLATLAEGPAAIAALTWEGFAARVAHWFPGGLLDSKVLATRALDGAGGGAATDSAATALRTVFDAVCAPPAAGGGRGGPTPPPPPSPLTPGPPPAHAPGFDRYAAASPAFEHEAGFDAYMTGAALIGLARCLAAEEAGQAAAAAAARARGDPRALVAALDRSLLRPASAAAAPSASAPVDIPALLDTHCGHLFAFASDRGALVLNPSIPAPLSPPTARDHIFFVLPVPPALGFAGLGRAAAAAVVAAGECPPGIEAGPPPQPRVRVLPRCGGAAALVECFDLLQPPPRAAPHGSASRPPPPPPPPVNAWGQPVACAPPPPPPSVADRAAAVAAALASNPALEGCRTLTPAAYEAWVADAGGWDGAAVAASAAARALQPAQAGGGGGGAPPPTAPPSPARRLAERWVAGVRARKRARVEDGGGGHGGGREEKCVVM